MERPSRLLFYGRGKLHRRSPQNRDPVGLFGGNGRAALRRPTKLADRWSSTE